MAKLERNRKSSGNSYQIENVLRDKKRIETPQKSFLWRVVLPRLADETKLVGISYNNAALDEAKTLESITLNMNERLSSRVTNISIPFSSVETDKQNIGNSYWYYAKQNDISSISFEMIEMEDGLTLQYLNAWQSLMLNEDGTYNPPVVYKKDLYFYRLSADKRDIHLHIYKDYFVSGIADISNDYETNEIVKYAVQLTGDSVEHYIFDIAGIISDPTITERLRKILSLDSALDSVDIALQGVVKEATGLNLPGTRDIAGGIGSLF
jgi:hypothetical protein